MPKYSKGIDKKRCEGGGRDALISRVWGVRERRMEGGT